MSILKADELKNKTMDKIRYSGRVLGDLVKENKGELAIYAAELIAIAALGEVARSAIGSSIEHGPHNIGTDAGLYALKEFARDYGVRAAQAASALVHPGVRYLRRKKGKQK